MNRIVSVPFILTPIPCANLPNSSAADLFQTSLKCGCFNKQRYSSSSPVSWSSTAWAASRRWHATWSVMDSLTVVWDWRRYLRTRAAIESSIYLGGLRMGLGGGSTIWCSTMGFWGDVTINRGGSSWTVGGDSSKHTLGTWRVSSICLSTLGNLTCLPVLIICLSGGWSEFSRRLRASKWVSSFECWIPWMASHSFVSALTMASASVTVGCVIYLCLKNTVSASCFVRVFLQKTTCVL